MQFVLNNITLTGLTEADAGDIALYLQDKEISDSTSRIPFPYSITDALKWIEDNLAFENENGFRKNFAIRNEAGQMLGCIGLHFNYGREADKSEFGYWLGKQFRNKGIMTEAVNKLAVLAREVYQLKSLEAHVFYFNHASRRTLIKAGFTSLEFIPDFYQKNGQQIGALKFVREL